MGSCLDSLCCFVGVLTGDFCSFERVVSELRSVYTRFVGLPMCAKYSCGLSVWCMGGWMSSVCVVLACVVSCVSCNGSECVLPIVGVHCSLDSLYIAGSGDCVCVCCGLDLFDSGLSSQFAGGFGIVSVRGVFIVIR